MLADKDLSSGVAGQRDFQFSGDEIAIEPFPGTFAYGDDASGVEGTVIVFRADELEGRIGRAAQFDAESDRVVRAENNCLDGVGRGRRLGGGRCGATASVRSAR